MTRDDGIVTWILLEEPSDQVAEAIGIVEARLGTEVEVTWLSPGPLAEPAQD